MKKWLVGFILVLVLALGALYFFLPAQPVARQMITVSGPQPAVFRALTDPRIVQQWLTVPSGKINTIKDTIVYTEGNHQILITGGMMHVVQMKIKEGEPVYNSTINIISLSQSASAIDWQAQIPRTANPFGQFENYFAARKVERRMQEMLDRLRTFLSKKENVYGLDIQATRVTDTVLAATQTITESYPQPQDYYTLIGKLKAHIAKAGARETNYPMLHINEQAGGKYSVMVAIPINQRIEEGGGIQIKRMVAGNLLVADTKGGPHTIRYSLQQFQYYITEQQYSTPAISYQLLVTDRLQQPDTAQWITRLCFPVY